MSNNKVAQSPVFPAGKKWEAPKRPGVYESDITALVRTLLQDESISADQRTAWERWRNDPAGLK